MSKTTPEGEDQKPADAPSGDTPSKVRDIAEKSVEQARDAVGLLLEAARKTAETIQTTTKTTERPEGVAVTKGFGYAKENISAIFDFAQKLVRSPDLKSAAQLQADFIKDRAEVMQQQVEELKGLSKTPGEPETPKS